MPDITMCEDKECPKKESCFRFMATPTDFRQAYFTESPRKGKRCKFYWGFIVTKKEEICAS